MSTDRITGFPMPWQKHNKVNEEISGSLELDQIDTLFGTTLAEADRGKFGETFFDISANTDTDNEIEDDARKFYEGLINPKNKEYLCKNLNLTDEEYDALACVALGLASQETGMGFEERPKNLELGDEGYFTEHGYQEENKGPWAAVRDAWITVKSKKSASSGLTQLKIWDFMKQNEEAENSYNYFLESLGVEATSKVKDNLYEEPDKAAVATIICLKSILDSYTWYHEEKVKMRHNELSQMIYDEYGKSNQEAYEIGQDFVMRFYDDYQNADDNGKIKIREALQDWFIAADDTTKANPQGYEADLNEEIQLEELNKVLSPENQLTQDSLNFIRYFLTDESMQMSPFQYLAYGWNKGTNSKVDRYLADVMALTLSDPEIYNYEQHTPNVVMITAQYAQQMDDASYELLDKIFNDYIKKKHTTEE